MIINEEEATRLLLSEHIVALPTETVYGLSGLYHSVDAHNAIYRAKNRPKSNPLIVHISSFDQLSLFAEEPTEIQRALASRFWPGPLTLLFTAKSNLPASITTSEGTVAVRMPNHPVFLRILEHTGPLVAPSANLSGRPSPTRALHVEHDYDSTIPVVDGGACTSGVESTIIRIVDEKCHILREGALSKEMLERFVPVEKGFHDMVVPGARFKHYSPQTPLLPLACGPVNAVIGFSNKSYEAEHVFSLGDSRRPEAIAQSLYAVLRSIDACSFDEVHVDLDFPSSGLYSTVHERLNRAMSQLDKV